MTPGSDKPVRPSIPSGLSPNSGRKAKAMENAWATATRRVLLYLKALGVPPRESLHLAQQALDCAEREPGAPPVQAALVALRSLLCARGVCASAFPTWWTYWATTEYPAPAAVPPLRPGQMSPARIDRRPWLTFLVRCARRCRSFFTKGRKKRETGKRTSLQTGPHRPEVKEERDRA